MNRCRVRCPHPRGILPVDQFGEGAQRERTFGCPVGAHASLAFSWARHAWHGGVEAGRSEPWPSGELRGPRGSSVAPGGAQGELSRPRQSDLRGSTVTPGELGRFALCGFLAPGGCATALSSLYNNFFFLPHAPHGLRFPFSGDPAPRKWDMSTRTVP